MLFGLNESTIDTNVSVEALVVPKHLEESVLGISAYGQAQAEKIYEAALELHGKYVTTLQRGISEGKLSEAMDVIIQEGALSNFFGKIKEFLKKIWATIKGMFEKFMAWLDSKMKSDKDFIAKYKKVLLQKSAKVSDMQYKGHEWGITDYPSDMGTEISGLATTLSGAGIDALKKTAEDLKTQKGETDAEYIKAAKELKDAEDGQAKADGTDSETQVKAIVKKLAGKLGVSSTDDGDEVVTLYREKLYGGEADAMTGPDVSGLISIVEGYDKEKTNATKAFKSLEKELNKSIGAFEKVEKQALKSESPSLASSTIVSMLKEAANITNRTSAVYLQAIKDRRDESRAILAKVITYKGE